MILNYLSTGDIKSAIVSFLLSVPIIILILSVHEYAHGLVARKLGDPTAESLGRLTLNPKSHIDPLGFLMFLLFGIGYAKPVPINSRYFKKPKRDMALVGAAGPLANFAMALLFTLLLKLLYVAYPFLPIDSIEWLYTALYYLQLLLIIAISYNLAFMVFNLIPVPPLDGSRILYAFLPSKILFKVQRYERYFFYGILAFFLVCSFLDVNLIGWAADLIMDLLFKLFFIA